MVGFLHFKYIHEKTAGLELFKSNSMIVAKFETWIRTNYEAVFKHALWMTGSLDVAEDMTQEAFYQAWICRHSLKDENRCLPWLLTILRRAIYREQRQHYRHQDTLERLIQQDQQTTDTDAFTLFEIYEAFESLTPKLRDAFLLFYLHGFSYDEISEQLEIPSGTVMSRISRARESLRMRQGSEGKIIKFVNKQGVQKIGQ